MALFNIICMSLSSSKVYNTTTYQCLLETLSDDKFCASALQLLEMLLFKLIFTKTFLGEYVVDLCIKLSC